ncbi:MAG TPA: response regulator, partial [Chromatiales bacterium]|nr:response regulator [Chromatiales bacterium]
MSSPERIWIIDDDRSIRWVLERALRQAGMNVESFESAAGVLDALARNPPDAIVTDVRMPGMNGMELLERVRAQQPALPVIIMTAHSDLDSAVSAYQGGAFEYLPKPFDIDEAVAVVRRAVAQRRTGQGGTGPAPPPPDAEIIGEAPAMQEVFRAIGRLSRSKITVLINGES